MKLLKHIRLLNASLERAFLKNLDQKLLDNWQNVRRLSFKAESRGHDQYNTALKAKMTKIQDQRIMIGTELGKLDEKISKLEIEIALQS